MEGTSVRTLQDKDIERQAALQAYGLLPGQDGLVSQPFGGPARTGTSGDGPALSGTPRAAGGNAAGRGALDNLVDLAALQRGERDYR